MMNHPRNAFVNESVMFKQRQSPDLSGRNSGLKQSFNMSP